MALLKPLEATRNELQELLIDDLVAAMRQLQNLLPNNSDKQQQVLALLGRLNAANKARLRGTISNEELQLLYNRVRADLLDLIAGLEETDFTAANTLKGKPAPKKGSVLYRIPRIMPLVKETKCVVRIALDEDAIVENIALDEHVQLKSLYRVSDTMQAEITDPSGGQVFRIRSTSEPVQLIDDQGYTEWRFYVTPVLEGSFPLEVKVAVIEMVNNQPHKKEIVLEEIVLVVTENATPEVQEELFMPAGFAFSLSSVTNNDPVKYYPGSEPFIAPARPASIGNTPPSRPLPMDDPIRTIPGPVEKQGNITKSDTQARDGRDIKLNASINLWRTGNEVRFALKPIPREGEDFIGSLNFKGNKVELNRNNLDPQNNTITSKVQAVLEFRDGEWYIENGSALKTTFIRVDEPVKLKKGDIILMGNRKFEFDC